MRKQKLAKWSVQARLDRAYGDRSQLCAAANLKNKWDYMTRERDRLEGKQWRVGHTLASQFPF
jgi:hypothetical protein